MADKVGQDSAQPSVVPGYGEADSEAASMSKAAQKDELRSQTNASEAERVASDAAAKVPPADAGPVGAGSSETDIKRRLAETARRKAEEAARAKT